MFAFLAAGIFSIEALSSQIADLRSGKISPEFSVSCVDTPENRMHVVDEIANLYGYFLTYQAHEKEQCSKLRAKGMWLEVKDADDYFPPQGKVGEFVLNLRQEMEADLMRNKESCITTKLGVDYGPDPGALSETFLKTGLDVWCNTLLPYKSLTYLEIKQNQLQIHVGLRGPLF
jgi:hypothetical protein